MFALNEKVVYPGHGVARVSGIIEKLVAGHTAHFYELRFINKEMTILVPVENLAAVGVRALSTPEMIQQIFTILSAPFTYNPIEYAALSSWNKRSKKYHALLRSGNVIEVAKIYRELTFIAQHKDLSFGERAHLQQAESLLVEEIALVGIVPSAQATEQLRAACQQSMPARRIVHGKPPVPTV